VLHLIGENTGFDPLAYSENPINIYPNPAPFASRIDVNNLISGRVEVEIFDGAGRRILQQTMQLQRACHTFKLSGMEKGLYIVCVSTPSGKYTNKLISMGDQSGDRCLTYLGSGVNSKLIGRLKNTLSDLVDMEYSDGDRLLLTGVSGDYSHTLPLAPTQSETFVIEFIECKDRDDRRYPVVTIGSQIWMAENLAYLPAVSPTSEESYTAAYYYVYDYSGTSVVEAKETENYQTYGAHYNYSAATSACPEGWHLPSDAEWSILVGYLGGESGAGGKVKEAGTAHWESPNDLATNETGFTGLPAGGRGLTGTFNRKGTGTAWWSATATSSIDAWGRFLSSDNNDLRRTSYEKDNGMSIRCIKN
ncbi:MAG: T9SS type A sorting domain-containing protein, partial [Bacteroidales bacterium]|nr:T9SS type A sorting domain-containing protein [Bacteroidales bacterium]